MTGVMVPYNASELHGDGTMFTTSSPIGHIVIIKWYSYCGLQVLISQTKTNYIFYVLGELNQIKL